MLLSSLEGAAITSVKIDGAKHEFATLPGVVEDVTDIVLNLKRVKFQGRQSRSAQTLPFREQRRRSDRGRHSGRAGLRSRESEAAHLHARQEEEIRCELEVRVGRGFATGEENKSADQPIGVIAIDSLFSPVTRVQYAVESARVGQRTDYDG